MSKISSHNNNNNQQYYEDINDNHQSHMKTPPPNNDGLQLTPNSISPSLSASQIHSAGSGKSSLMSVTTNGLNNNQYMQTSTSLPELQTQVTQLSDRVMRETRRRRSLEHAVRRLTEENRRLQDESQAATQQLRRFTEWFFQTIDRQS